MEIVDSRSVRFELADFPLADRSLVRLRSRSSLWRGQRKVPSDPFVEAALGSSSSSSLTSSAANADGAARERIALDENMGTSITGASRPGSGSSSMLEGLVRPVLLFIASFDCFESETFLEVAGDPEGMGGNG